MSRKIVGFRIKLLKTQNLEKPKVIREKILFIQRVAIPLGWKIAAYISEEDKLILKKSLDFKEIATITIHLDQDMVITKLKHPKHPEYTLLKREDITQNEMAKILMNPRAHTSKGMYLNSTTNVWLPSHTAQSRIATSASLRRNTGRKRSNKATRNSMNE